MRKTIAQLWEDIFYDYKILKEIKINGYYIITADQIRAYKEPRLMTKFDFSKQLSPIFKDNELGILPIRNGEYVIGKFDLFKKISNSNYEQIEIKKVEFDSFIETIDPDNIYSESNALKVAYLAGMFEDAFGEKLYETIQGKMRTNKFDFKIYSNNIENHIYVNGVAIEIDAGFEGESKVVLVEAKNYLPDDFIIRQLYYPYRFWSKKIYKKIIPVFFTYDNGIYNLFIYEFEDLSNYNSISLKDIKRYSISSNKSDTMKRKIFTNISFVGELPQHEVPFPQADSFSKVIGALELINTEVNTAKKIAVELEIDDRQGKYYIDSLRYLGLVEKDEIYGKYKLTGYGFVLINNYERKLRNQILIRRILQHRPFYEVYEYYLENGEIPNREFIRNVIKKYIPDMSYETINRRASTIRGWVQWIIGVQV